ncbi:CpsD/CapB family tyrosine-protein kinase [Thiolapillus sp.]
MSLFMEEKDDEAHKDASASGEKLKTASLGSSLELRLKSARQIALMKEPLSQNVGQLRARKIIDPEMKDRDVLDAFRKLRTKLLQISNGENFIVMLASVAPGNGASFSATNLAVAFALDNTKTALVVDCNFRNPIQHKRFGVGGRKEWIGLTDYIENPDTMDPEGWSVDDIIYPTGIKRVSVVPVGKRREASQEYVASAHMEAFFAEVRNRYPDRFIFVDAPSVSESPDAMVLADLCDMVVLCVGYGKATLNQIAQAAAEFGNEKLVGVIFTEGAP